MFSWVNVHTGNTKLRVTQVTPLLSGTTSPRDVSGIAYSDGS